MVFSSQLFVFWFLPLTLALYHAVPRRAQNLLLTVASFAFYGWGNPIFIVLLLVSTLIDYIAGLVIVSELPARPGEPLPLLEVGGPRSRRQKLALASSMVANLLLLGFFKYFNFAIDSWNAAIAAAGLEALRLDTLLQVILPLGISFYTFQSMSYAIDVYRGEARAMRSLLDFCCFESMFPQLVAGPIIRFSEVAEQLRSRTISLERFARGISFFACGLAKKVLLANPCGQAADMAFEASSLHASDAWLGLVAYSFQIYFDFSGYSDMAVGLGLMLGFVFAQNFDAPYHSQSLTEFWRRWHISLSTWLRDYLYRPLGGNRKGPRRTYINLALVMLLGGLWHGAAWTFVVWGAIHGIMLALERWAGKDGLWRGAPRPLRVAATFGVVCFAWVFFRAPGMGAARDYLASLAGLAPVGPAADLVSGILWSPHTLIAIAIAALVTWAFPQAWVWTRELGWGRALASFALLACALASLSTQGHNPFIYFIF